MIIIAGRIEFGTQEQRDAACVASAPLQQASRDDEPGCRAYCFAPDPCEGTIMQVYELWDDEASLAAHFEHENYFNMRTLLGEMGIVGADNNKYRCDLEEPVYDETRTARADFFTAS